MHRIQSFKRRNFVIEMLRAVFRFQSLSRENLRPHQLNNVFDGETAKFEHITMCWWRIGLCAKSQIVFCVFGCAAVSGNLIVLARKTFQVYIGVI